MSFRLRVLPGGKSLAPLAIMAAFALLAFLSGCKKNEESLPRTPTEEVEETAEAVGDTNGAAETGGEAGKSFEAEEGFGYADTSGGTEEVMVLKDIRFGDHGTYERVVLEFAPQAYHPRSGNPRFAVRYLRSPYVDEEGNSTDLGGPYLLEIRFNANKADLSDPEGEVVRVYTGPDAFSPGLTVISLAKMVPAHEHNSLVLLIGLRDHTPFRVQELLEPPRIVVDVRKR